MSKALKILMIEDMDEDVGLIERVLKADKISFVSLRVDDKAAYL